EHRPGQERRSQNHPGGEDPVAKPHRDPNRKTPLEGLAVDAADRVGVTLHEGGVGLDPTNEWPEPQLGEIRVPAVHLPLDGGQLRLDLAAPWRLRFPIGQLDSPRPLQWDHAPPGPSGSMSQTTVRARYQVIARVAAGGMGEVFRARDSVLDRDVAIKVLHRNLAGDPGFIDRFRREARAAALLSHPNIVSIHDWVATSSGTYFMVMEFVRGRNLRDLLTHFGRLEPQQ